MKISLNWLKKYVDIKIPNEDLVRLIGARLVEVEGVIDESHKYDNIFIVKVESCEKIPDTHLSKCLVNVGEVELPKVKKDEKGLVQVMCGAPNVHAGMLAVWIAPGAIVPASVHEDAPFVIGKRTMLKKYDSYGMLAAADELDLGDDHAGIIEIDPKEAQLGQTFVEVFDLNDQILEIENKSLTHRPDCFGLIGFAREVAGILGQPFKFEMNLEQALFQDKKSSTGLTVKIAGKDICPRYSALVLEKHGEIKKKYFTWIDTILAKSGMRPIDPIVDATNYLMLLYGQPLHAFDYDKFVKVGKTDKPVVVVREAKKGEKLVLLDDKEIELTENDILITSNDVPVGLAGAMGGKSTMIDENTKNILLESATFSLYNMRKTQMAHGIFSEAITRYTKGQPPFQTLEVAKKCADMLSEGFKVAAIADEYSAKSKANKVIVTVSDINKLLGTNYDKKLIEKTLENVQFEVAAKGETLTVTAPDWRTDIAIKEDIIEEVGRLLGYDNIAPELPSHFTAEKNTMFEMKKNIRALMSKYGANELLTYSFVSGQLLKKSGLDVDNSYRIINSISPELQYVRQSIVPSLLEKSFINEKMPIDAFAIYEMNFVYRKELGLTSENVPVQKASLGFVVAERKNKETAYYKAKKYIAKLFDELNIEIEFVAMKNSKKPEAKPFEKKRSADVYANGEYIGVVGEFKNSVRSEFKLAPYLAGFEIDLDILLEHTSHKKQIDSRKKVREDLTVTTDKTYGEALKEVQKNNPDAKITPGVIYQAENQKTRNITFHLEK